jgi:hypothetical protein
MSGEDKTDTTKMLSYGQSIMVLIKDGSLSMLLQEEDVVLSDKRLEESMFITDLSVFINTDHSELSPISHQRDFLQLLEVKML